MADNANPSHLLASNEANRAEQLHLQLCGTVGEVPWPLVALTACVWQSHLISFWTRPAPNLLREYFVYDLALNFPVASDSCRVLAYCLAHSGLAKHGRECNERMLVCAPYMLAIFCAGLGPDSFSAWFGGLASLSKYRLCL